MVFVNEIHRVAFLKKELRHCAEIICKYHINWSNCMTVIKDLEGTGRNALGSGKHMRESRTLAVVNTHLEPILNINWGKKDPT